MVTRPFPETKHLLVDLDGTLLGANNFLLNLDFTGKALVILKKHGGWLRALKGLKAIQQELERPCPKPGVKIPNDRRFAQAFARSMGLPEDEGLEILEEMVGNIFPTIKRHFFPIPGAKKFLEWAASKYPLTLATNPVWPEEFVRLRLEWAGVDPSIFNGITHSRIMHSCKPSVEYYREVIEHFGTKGIKPENFLLIGDDMRNDLPATRAGIPVYILSPQDDARKLKLKGAKALAMTGTFKTLQSFLNDL